MRSYVDPIINAAVISQIDLRRDLASLLTLDFPERFLPTFLHEGTHHACFMSPLGTTLALLRMRAYRRATALRTRPEADHWDLLEDVLRQEVTMELLRPLSEGLACFSELDSVPGKSNVITTPMTSTFFNFGGPDHELKTQAILREHGPNLFLFSLLYRARLDPDLAQRRENVLAGKFPMRFGGHLAGYMALKNIWAGAKAKSDRAHDAELFSMYLRSFFYDDYALIAVLLDDSASEHNAANAIGAYILGRLKQLITLDWEAALENFEREFGRTAPSGRVDAHLVHPLPSGLSNDRHLHDIGVKGLESLVSELIDISADVSELFEVEDQDLVRRLMCNFDARRLRKRELLCLGSLEAEIEVNTHGRVFVRPQNSGLPDNLPIFNVEAMEGTKEGKDHGSLEFYLIPSDNARASAIVRGRELVHVHFEGPVSSVRREQLSDLFGTRAKDLAIIGEQEANLEFVIARDSIRFVRDQAKKTAPEGIEHLYRWLTTLPIKDDRWKSAADALSSGGFFKLCGSDGDFIRGLAFLGVASSVNRNKAELIEIAKCRELDLVELQNKAGRIEAETGFPTILEAGEEIAVLV